MIYLTGIRLQEINDNSSYLTSLPAVKYLKAIDELSFKKPVTFFVGENGTGKSTLLEAIAVSLGFNPEGGSIDFSFSTSDSHSDLYKNITTIKTLKPKDGFFLRAESFYNTASYLDEVRDLGIIPSDLKRYGGKSLHSQSHGEAFLSLFKNRFEGNGIYILDEPEAALSPTRLMTLIVLINELVKKNSQFIIATHSPILMAYPDAEIYQFSDNGIEKTEYKNTEHYVVTKQFMDFPERMIKLLLE